MAEAGRPEITEEQKKDMLDKVKPYLTSGLSIRKSLREAGIPRASFYNIMDRDEEFRSKIDQFRQFTSIMLNNAVIRHLQDIIRRQNFEPTEEQKAKGIFKLPLSKDDLEFLKWFATNSNLTREEFGERKDVGFYDPEAEIQRLARIMESDEGEDDEPKEE